MSKGSRLRRSPASIAVAAMAAVVAWLATSTFPASPALGSDAVRQVAPQAAPRPTGPAVVTVPAEGTTVTAAAPPASRGRGAAERGELSITVDRAKVIRLPERTQTVVIGNPSIADLAIQKNGIVVVTGKSYGVTNLIALDAAGNMLAESTVSVGAPTDAIVVVQRGLERQSYSCTPSCQPSILLGDATTYFNENRGQAEQRNQFATQR